MSLTILNWISAVSLALIIMGIIALSARHGLTAAATLTGGYALMTYVSAAAGDYLWAVVIGALTLTPPVAYIWLTRRPAPEPTVPFIEHRRMDLVGHTITIERCDLRTARAQWDVPDRDTLVGRLAVIERTDGYLSKVCHLEGRDTLYDASLEEFAQAAAHIYGARYVPAEVTA